MNILDLTPPPGTPMPLLVIVREVGFFAVDLQPEEIRHAKLDAAVLPEAVSEAHANGFAVEHWLDTSIRHVSALDHWMVQRAEAAAGREPTGLGF